MLFAAGILGFVFVGELEDSVRSSLEKSLKENYGVPGKESITNSWNSVQQNVSISDLHHGFILFLGCSSRLLIILKYIFLVFYAPQIFKSV